MPFDEDWARDAEHAERSARERDLEAKRRRWADLDRQDLQGRGQAHRQAARARRQERWRAAWPWLAFFGLAAVLITVSSMLGF